MPDDEVPQGQETGTEGGQQDLGQPVVQSEPTQQTQTEKTLGEEFLATIPEANRKLFEPVIKEWDAKVTQRFQGIHEQYKPWKELGVDPTVAAQAVHLYNLLQTEPQKVYSALKEAFEQQEALQNAGQGLGSPAGQTVKPVGQAGQAPVANGQTQQQQVDPYADFDPRLAEFMRRQDDQTTRQQKLLGTLAQWVVGQEDFRKQQQEDQQLDKYLTDLHTKHGDFDESIVLSLMNNGMDAEAAIGQVQNLIKTEAQRIADAVAVPPTLSGGGRVPVEGFDPGKVGRKDLQSAVAGLLEQTARGGS